MGLLLLTVVHRGKLYKSDVSLGCESQENLISVWYDGAPAQTLTSIHTSSLMVLSYWGSGISRRVCTDSSLRVQIKLRLVPNCSVIPKFMPKSRPLIQ